LERQSQQAILNNKLINEIWLITLQFPVGISTGFMHESGKRRTQ
jgi:hypothetical protein